MKLKYKGKKEVEYWQDEGNSPHLRYVEGDWNRKINGRWQPEPDDGNLNIMRKAVLIMEGEIEETICSEG